MDRVAHQKNSRKDLRVFSMIVVKCSGSFFSLYGTVIILAWNVTTVAASYVTVASKSARADAEQAAERKSLKYAELSAAIISTSRS